MLERKTIAILLCAGIIAGCSVLEKKQSSVLHPPIEDPATTWRENQESEVLAWIAAYRTLSSASLEKQRTEYQAAQTALAKAGSESNRLRLALVLSLPGIPWRDDNKLMNTLESPSSLLKATDSPLNQLAFMLYKQAQERLRLRDEQRRRDAELFEEQRRSEELQMKLEALRRIDQDLKHRNSSPESLP